MDRSTPTRTELIDNMGEVFSRYGDEGASLTRLSTASGLRRSSLYHRFPGGKDEIVEAVLARATERYEGALAPAFADGPPRERAKQVAAGLNEYYGSGVKPCLLVSLTVSDAEDRSMAGECIDAWADALMHIAADAGLTPEEADAAAMDAIAAIEGGLVIASTSGKTAAYERALETLPDRLTGSTPCDFKNNLNNETQPEGNDMNDTTQIHNVIDRYIQAGVDGDATAMKSAYHEQATIHLVADGKVEGGPIQILFDAVEGNPAPNLTGVVNSIEVNGTTATATLTLNDWAGDNYTDQFTLLKTDSWKVLSKVYHDRG
ncbi:MAG: nuclear transport factor 2 family protein [Acidimicrobiia bacterium]|nr:nuclear transport factor 2 family protein [Acidimicrobiia bacterium]